MSLFHRIGIVLAALPLIAIAGDAPAPTKIVQKNRAFSKTDVAVRKGETIVFRNDDDVMHNVFSTSQGNEFNAAQAPGAESEITFSKPGTVQIRCAIHPKMKLTVTVNE